MPHFSLGHQRYIFLRHSEPKKTVHRNREYGLRSSSIPQHAQQEHGRSMMLELFGGPPRVSEKLVR
jgi:hypothetical protein